MNTQNFARLLRNWRLYQGLTQVQLAERTKISHRHLNFLESSRSSPSETVVRDLCNALTLSSHNADTLTRAAGFNAYDKAESHIPQDFMSSIVKMLSYQNPYPAFAIDRNGDVIAGNISLLRNYQSITQLPDDISQLNILDLVLSDSGIKPYIVDWDKTAAYLHRIVIQESLSRPQDESLQGVLRRVENHPDFDQNWKDVEDEPTISPVTIFKLKVKGIALSYLVSYLTLGSGYNSIHSRVHVILLHPQDAFTSDYMRQSYFGDEQQSHSAFSFKSSHD